jgi:hypothetical protein
VSIEVGMRTVARLSEDEMVAAFLKAEAASPKYGPRLRLELARLGLRPELLERPDTTDRLANGDRRAVLDAHRGYLTGTRLFDGFPDDVDWWLCCATPKDLATVRYIDYDFWNDHSEGTRLPAVAAARLRANGQAVPAREAVEGIVEGLRHGRVPPPVILVGRSPADPLVVLEGHTRLTAYAYAPEALPPELEVIAGWSTRMGEWGLYGY